MFIRMLFAGGPRPAELFLPPTLQPNAIAAMAPPRHRGVSLLSACSIYSLAAMGLYFASHQVRETLKPPIRPENTLVVDLPPGATQQPLSRELPAHGRSTGKGAGASGARPLAPETLQTLPPESSSPMSLEQLPDLSRTGLHGPTEGLPGTGSGTGDGNGDAPGVRNGTGNGTGQGFAGEVRECEFAHMQVLKQVAPTYPISCKLGRLQGEVELQLLVDPLGRVQEVHVLRSPNALFAREAERVARLWSFAPARMDGNPVAARFRLTFVFKLA